MRFIDVFGPPGVGKSTVCDHFFHPHAITWQWVKEFPAEWQTFLDECEKLMEAVKDHPTAHLCRGMVDRSLRKMAAVHAKNDPRVYIQTGFAQRGLGFGWRLEKPEAIRRFYELMPISVGVVSLWAPPELVMERNRGREAQNENRAHMVMPMARPREIALEVLRQRGVPVLELDTRQPATELRKQVLDFANSPAGSVQSTAA